MKIDEQTLEAIVREVIQRLLAKNPELVQSLSSGLSGGASGGASQGQDANFESAIFEHYGRVVSEGDLLLCRKQGKRAIRVEPRAIVTPLARDRARDMGFRILTRGDR